MDSKNILYVVTALICALLMYSSCQTADVDDSDAEQLTVKECDTLPQQMNVSDLEPAEFKVTFIATWSRNTHPVNFPSGPHFSPLNGAIHSPNIKIWETGEPASNGIESMAETGSTMTLTNEVNDLGDNARRILGSGISPSPGVTEISFTATTQRNQISLVSMLAPSHDWFIGIANFNLIENSQWIDEIVIDLRLYDAGTEEGNNFSFSGSDTTPRGLISRLITNETETDFGNSGTEAGEPFVGRFIICRK